MTNNIEPRAGIPGRRWWIATAVVSAAMILLIISGALIVRLVGGEGQRPDEMAELPTNYIDTAESQVHDLEPVAGLEHGRGGMTMTINGDHTAVDPVQLTDAGTLIPPAEISRVGWYSASAVPGAEGAAGSTVITGHVNHENQGDGYARKFADLQPGQRFTVVTDGQPRDFEVTEAPYRLTKGAPLPAVVNDTTGPNRLVLITCGGNFVGGQLGYADNIITVAEPR